jgi:methionine synthase I (cobalamin-dependent)
MTGKVFDGQTINENATRIVKEVASGGGALTAGSITRCTSYAEKKGKDAVQEEFRKQFKVFVEFGLDFVILEVKVFEIKPAYHSLPSLYVFKINV